MSPLKLKRLSDESLGSRLASGEAAAFDELYRRYVHRLSAYGSHLLGDADSGDDVAQAALFKAYAALRDGRVPDKMKPWLFRIAHNAAIDLVARRRELPSDNLPERPAVEREPFAGALVEALATLPERQRRVYVLREVHGLRIDETAAELELNAGQVEQALFAARNRLAEQLVFGDRLNCVTVQRLSAGPLDAPERRALKTHLRSCDACRRTLGVRGRALSLFPSSLVPSSAGLEWLRGLGAGLLGGGAPAAAKIGAVFATATIAAGVPVAVEKTTHHRTKSKALQRLTVSPHQAPVSAPQALVSSAGSGHAIALTSVSLPARAHHEASTHDGSGDGSRGEHRSAGGRSTREDGSSGGSDGSGDASGSKGSEDGGHVAVSGSGSGGSDGGGSGDGTEQRDAAGRDGSSGKQLSSERVSGSQEHQGETTATRTGSGDSGGSGEGGDSGGGSGDSGGSGDGGDSGSGGGGSGGDGGQSGGTTTTTTTTTTTPTTTTTVPITPELPPLPPAG